MSIKKSREFYRSALVGARDAKGQPFGPGLRETAKGFTSADGFNLRDIDNWTPAQKAKVTKYWHELQRLTAQPRYLFKTRSASKLEQAQRVVQSDTKYKWRVAFIPHTPKRTKSGKLSKAAPRITFTKQGVRIREARYAKHFIPLDSEGLVKNAAKEIKAAIKRDAPDATRFTVQAGKNEMPGLVDKTLISDKVVKLMLQYDGRRALPKGSGNSGDSPQCHKWDHWLTGLVGYEFPKTTAKAVSEAVNEFDVARRELQLKRRAQRKRIARKGKKKSNRR